MRMRVWWDGAVHAMEDRRVKCQYVWTRTPGTSSSDTAPPFRSCILLPFILPLGEWSCTVERSGAEEMTAVRNRLIWMAYVATWGHMMSRSILSQRVMSGSLTLPQLRSVLMSMARVITEGHLGNRSLCQHLRPCSLMAILLLGPY